MLSMEAMPWTTVQKMTGAIIIFTKAMKPSPSGFRPAPKDGQSQPTRAPTMTPIRHWT